MRYRIRDAARADVERWHIDPAYMQGPHVSLGAFVAVSAPTTEVPLQLRGCVGLVCSHESSEYGRVNMRVRLIFAALAVGVSPLAGCGSTPSHRPAAREPREQVVTVTGAVGPPKSPKEKQLARELKGVEGSSP